jgi:hypothetical protein
MKKKGGVLSRKKERYVPTNEDWYGNYEGNKVLVSVSLKENTKLQQAFLVDFLKMDFAKTRYYVQVTVFGNDDIGVCKEQYFEDDKEAFKAYHEQCKWMNSLKNAAKADLLKEGFENF